MKQKKSNRRPLTKKEIYNEIKNILLVIAGSAVLGIGTGIFLVPFDIIAGGVTGIGIALDHFLGNIFPQQIDLFGIAPITMMDVYVTGLTWIMFFAGLIILGKNFAIKTLVSSIFYPVFFTVSNNLVRHGAFNGFFDLSKHVPTYAYDLTPIAPLVAAVFGGALVGAGCAITFMGGGSTGGVDIIALSICKFFKRAKSSVVIFLVDASVVVMGMFAVQNLGLSLLGIASAIVCAVMIDQLFVGSSKAFKAEIVSESADLINEEVRRRLDRTTTFISAVGGYSKEPKKMIMLTFTIREYSEVLNIINTIDKDAFVTITSAHEINGEGWTFNTKKDGKSRGQLEQEKKQRAENKDE